MDNWMDMIGTIKGGALLVCIMAFYKVVLGILVKSKEDRLSFIDLIKDYMEHLANGIDKLADRVKSKKKRKRRVKKGEQNGF